MTTMHYSEDDLILYYYGEHRRRVRVERHLAECAACRESYTGLAATLSLVEDGDTPERGDLYGLEVWQRIRHHLPDQEPSWRGWGRPRRLAFAGGAVVLVLIAFVAGRSWPDAGAPVPAVPVAVEEAPDAGERIRLAAVGDHLEESARVLLDFVNADGAAGAPADVSIQQAWAADLIGANRLYRDASSEAGDETAAALLDEIERNLLELVHGPATLTPAQLDDIRTRLDAAALLFRVRVLSEDLREQQLAFMTPRKTT